jgi:hypothetical protein
VMNVSVTNNSTKIPRNVHAAIKAAEAVVVDV